MDATLLTILVFGMLMSMIALIGALLLFLPPWLMEQGLKPLVAFAAGSLVGGAFFHMVPHALHDASSTTVVMLWVVVGFAAFFALDQLLEWHHCQRPAADHIRPLGPLLLAADGVHNLLGGLAVGAIFTADLGAGLSAWTAAALHEIPQKTGNFGAIVHAGYPPMRALFYNFLVALTFPLGGVIAYCIGRSMDVHFLVALGAGNFLYIAGADLIPEIKTSDQFRNAVIRFALFALGVGVLYAASALTS